MPTLGSVHVRRVVPFVLLPEATSLVTLEVKNRGKTSLVVRFNEVIPTNFAATPLSDHGRIQLQAGSSGSVTYQITAPRLEGPVLMTGTMTVEAADQSSMLDFETPISVYPQQRINTFENLADIRDRLVAVTNFHKRSGHLLMMDSARYFMENLNVILSDKVKKAIASEFAFTTVGLPVPREEYDLVRDGDSEGVFGIDYISLDAEDFTNCDELFEPKHVLEYAREVQV